MTHHPFSPTGRRAALERLAAEEFDLLVIGGGISGCGLARDAKLRGLNVALVEKGDFASGTSSRSSKLVHGGIRYLAYGEVNLVRESARERKALRQIAPHLIHPLPFVFPLYGGNLATYRAGFWMFDKLAGATPEEEHRVLTLEELSAKVPALREGATAALEYGEYITDDGRFTLENAMSAAEQGAAVANYAPLVAFVTEHGRITGGVVKDGLTGQEYRVRARVVVNATGPWAEETLKRGSSPPPRQILPSKGIHLLFRASRLPLENAVALKSPGGREGFAIRRWDYVYIGTTDEPHHGPLDGPVADREAAEELLKLAQDCFPSLGLTEADIVSTWAGLRPLIAEPGKAPRDTSRHDEVWRSPEGLLTLAGGKLTTYRAMAGRLMEHVAQELGRDLGDNRRTLEVPLPGADLGGRRFEEFRAAMQDRLTARGVSERAANRITWIYGGRVQELLRFGEEDSAWLKPLAEGVDALRGEVRLAVEQEMALTLPDFMDRRAALLLFAENHGLGAVEEAASLMATMLGWSEEQRAAQVSAYRQIAVEHGVPARVVR
ncbi:MAG: FAD-dependent oxidoreductase [Bacillota bacterium]